MVMGTRRKRQANLFEELPRVPELPILRRGKALTLLGSLLTEALARTDEEKKEGTNQIREVGNDENHG
jgi:hypothetical protein